LRLLERVWVVEPSGFVALPTGVSHHGLPITKAFRSVTPQATSQVVRMPDLDDGKSGPRAARSVEGTRTGDPRPAVAAVAESPPTFGPSF
jgi:hypothetical protein